MALIRLGTWSIKYMSKIRLRIYLFISLGFYAVFEKYPWYEGGQHYMKGGKRPLFEGSPARGWWGNFLCTYDRLWGQLEMELTYNSYRIGERFLGHFTVIARLPKFWLEFHKRCILFARVFRRCERTFLNMLLYSIIFLPVKYWQILNFVLFHL